MKNWWLYVLKLEQGKYYVGITSKTPQERFQQHKNGFLAARWTKKFKPLELYYEKELGYINEEKAKEFENKVTSKYIKKYGIENVRGGNLNYEGRYQRVGIKTYLEDKDFSVLLFMLVALSSLALITVYLILT